MIYDVPESVNFSIGDLVIDFDDKEAGILIEKYKILPERVYESGYTTEPIWAWRILWSGPAMSLVNRYAAYTETGLKNMIFCGRMVLIKN
tara:strand:- start:205 stop:474 length:270 start_codon:yes stop_codon:yes gene_type:complete